MRKNTDDEIWETYLWMKKFEEYNGSKKQFCNENGIPYLSFINVLYRINNCRYTHPERYIKLMNIGKLYLSRKGGITAKEIASMHNIEKASLTEIITHMRYLSVIEERLKKQERNKEIKFIAVEPIKASDSNGQMGENSVVASKINESIDFVHQPAEVIINRNDIEITISKGIKVSIAPDIDSTKIIKIIDLLKDL